jgi:hypothetical protein
MSRDPLELATRALKEKTEVAPEDLRRVRARVLATVHARERTRSRRWVYALPLAAALAATTAFAARSGGLDAIASFAASLVGSSEDEAPMAPPPGRSGGAEGTAAERATTDTQSDTRTDTQADTQSDAQAETHAENRTESAVLPDAPAASAPRPSAAPSDESEAELHAYRHAHELHFVTQDCARAVPAWERYLALAPRGAFVAEARYNRGVCLARLGRADDARAALAPFAEGTAHGGYRQRESRALIDALAADGNAP